MKIAMKVYTDSTGDWMVLYSIGIENSDKLRAVVTSERGNKSVTLTITEYNKLPYFEFTQGQQTRRPKGNVVKV